MAHFYAECTDNIREQAELPVLFSNVNQTLVNTGLFPLAGIRSRAIWLDTWQMADGQQDYAFVHMTLKIGYGRSIEHRQAVGKTLCLDSSAFRSPDVPTLSGFVVRHRGAGSNA